MLIEKGGAGGNQDLVLGREHKRRKSLLSKTADYSGSATQWYNCNNSYHVTNRSDRQVIHPDIMYYLRLTSPHCIVTQ